MDVPQQFVGFVSNVEKHNVRKLHRLIYGFK